MKKLELNQMEVILGGNTGCAADSISLGLAVLAVVLAAATGPFGWAAALAIASGGITGGILISNGNCF